MQKGNQRGRFCLAPSEVDLIGDVWKGECERTRLNLTGQLVELMPVVAGSAGCVDMLYGPLMRAACPVYAE